MRQVRTRHWACGTEVVEAVPEGCDLSEGLALVCPRCRDAWWYYPDPERALVAGAAADAAAAAPEGGAAPAAQAPGAGEDELPGRDPPRGLRASPPRPASGLVRLCLGLLTLSGVAVLVLALVDTSPRRDEPASAPRIPAAAAPTPPPPAAPPRQAVQAPATVRVAGRGFTLRRPRGWIAYRRGSALVVAPGRRAPVSVRVVSSRRRGVSASRIARLRAAALRSQLRGASVSGPARVRVGDRTGLKVTARRGAAVRQMTVVAAGARRYVLEVRTTGEATDADRAAATAIERSFRVRN